MSIYATNYILDWETGLPKLVKHLNKARIDRNCIWNGHGKQWNKSGKLARLKKEHNKWRNKNNIIIPL